MMVFIIDCVECLLWKPHLCLLPRLPLSFRTCCWNSLVGRGTKNAYSDGFAHRCPRLATRQTYPTRTQPWKENEGNIINNINIQEGSEVFLDMIQNPPHKVLQASHHALLLLPRDMEGKWGSLVPWKSRNKRTSTTSRKKTTACGSRVMMGETRKFWLPIRFG